MKKKVLILAAMLSILLLGFGTASANWEAQYPESAMAFPYFNSAAGFQTYILVSQLDDATTTWTGPTTTPNVKIKFNPKCGRGEARSFTLTTKQTLVMTPPVGLGYPTEGWVEAYISDDLSDGDADGDYPLNGYAVILDITNGVSYGYKPLNYYSDVLVDLSNAPINYYDTGEYWGTDVWDPIVANLWRHSDFGRTVFVLLDPNGSHRAACTGTIAANPYVGNMAQLDIFSKSETDSHKTVEWCTATADKGKPGIVTIGVGTTAGVFGTTDTSISNPMATMSDAPYGWGWAYNMRNRTFVDLNLNGVFDALEDYGDGCANGDIHALHGVVFSRISNVSFPKTTDSHRMDYLWMEND